MPPDPDQVSALFTEALAIPLTDRDAFLDRACRHDSPLRRRVVDLLAAYAAAGNFLEPARTCNEPTRSAASTDTPSLPAAGDHEVVVGNTFGDYELLEEVARGGMGVVFKARQVNLDRVVALKMILTGWLARPEDVRRFHQEAEAAASLDHPGIVPIYEVGEHAGRHYYSMAFVEGASLADRVAEGSVTPRGAAELVRAIAVAVQYAHDRGVIHRDLKPANVLLDRDGRPRVTDFGLARRVERPSELTRPDQVFGTPGYMPPEQAEGAVDRLGPRSDVYGLGAIFYALLTGLAPFRGSSAYETITRVIRDEPVPPRKLRPAIARDLETICLKCLEKDPARRYESAQALADDLGRFLAGETVHARPVGRAERAYRWARRHRRLLATAAGTVLLVLGLAVGADAVITGRKKAAVSERTRAFVEAVQRDDREALAGLVTENGRRHLAAHDFRLLRPAVGEEPFAVEYGPVSVSGDEGVAQVGLVGGGRRRDLELRLAREADGWKVRWMDFTDVGVRITIEIETPVLVYVPPAPRPPDVFAVTSSDKFVGGWSVDLDVRDQPAGVVIDRLAKDLGLIVVRRDDVQAALARAVAFRQLGVARVWGIEEACRQVGLHTAYEGKSVTLKPGPRPTPATTAGPFLVEIESITLYPEHAVGFAVVSARGFGLPARSIGTFDRSLECTDPTAPGGASLVDAGARYPGVGWAIEPDMVEIKKLVPLKNLLRGVTEFRLGATATLRLRTKSHTARIESLKIGAEAKAGKANLRIDAVTAGPPFQLQLSLTGARFGDCRVVALDKAGNEVRPTTSGGSDETQQMVFDAAPAALTLDAADMEEFAFQCEFDKIPVPDAARRPVALAPAQFGKHAAPVTVEVLRFAGSGFGAELQLRVVNHADRPVRKVEAMQVSRDAAGKVVDESHQSYAPEPPLPPGLPTLAAAGTKVEFTPRMAFLLPETKTVEVVVRLVEFVDGAHWSRR